MEPYWQRGGATLFHGDCRAVLAQLEPESVQCCVTSPPYWGLRDYGLEPSVWGGADGCDHQWGDVIAINATNHTDKRRWNHTRNGRDEEQPTEKRVAWLRTKVPQGQFCQSCGAWAGCLGLEPTPELFVEHILEVCRAVRRTLRDDGTLWLNLGDCYHGSWQNYGGGARGAGKQRPIVKGSQAQNPVWDGLEGWRPPASFPHPTLKPKDRVMMPARVALALQADGWWLRDEIVWHKPNPMPVSVQDRTCPAHEFIYMLTKSARYRYDRDAIATKASAASSKRYSQPTLDSKEGGFKQEAYESGLVGQRTRSRRPAEVIKHLAESRSDKATKRSVWSVCTKPFKGAHFATFPPVLITPCILAGCPEGGVVLDPFTGSGTTGVVSLRYGRRFAGIDANADYLEMAKKRIGREADKHALFGATP